MKIFYKGLIDSKYFFRNMMVIIFVILIALIMNGAYNNIVHKKDVESNKIEYRTILIKANSDIEQIINNNSGIIENYDFIEKEYVSIVFKRADYIDDFLKEYSSYFDEVERTAPLASDKKFGDISVTLMFLLNHIVAFITIIFLVIMNINYLIHIEKELALYNILGLPKILCYISILLLIFLISMGVEALSYLVVKIISNYMYCKVEYYLLLIPIIGFILSIFVYAIYSRKKSSYIEMKKDFSLE